MSWSSVCIFFESLIKISNIIKTCSIAAFCYAFFLRKQYASFVYSVSINKLNKGKRCGFFEKITKCRFREISKMCGLHNINFVLVTVFYVCKYSFQTISILIRLCKASLRYSLIQNPLFLIVQKGSLTGVNTFYSPQIQLSIQVLE